MSPAIAQAFTYFLAMLFCLTIHEAAHAWAAKLRGDTTAEDQGRLTLNPLPHVDPIGTVLFPLLGSLLGGGVLGWAKPVPVDLRNLKDPKWDHVLVAAAGPLSNLLFCVVCIAGLLIHEVHFAVPEAEQGFFHPLVGLLRAMIYVNAILAVFNLIPLPPLDGATVFGAVLPHRWAQKYDEYVAPYGFLILLAMFISGGLGWVWNLATGYIGLIGTVLAPFLT